MEILLLISAVALGYYLGWSSQSGTREKLLLAETKRSLKKNKKKK